MRSPIGSNAPNTQVSPELADAADVLSDQLRVHLHRLAALLEPHTEKLERRFLNRLRALEFQPKQRAALAHITPGAAARILVHGRPPLKFMPVLDNLERALQSNAGGDTLRGGVEQTLRGFEALLAGEGVKAIEVKGQRFDPRVAEAIGTSAADGVAEDTVVEVAEKGYTLGDELLRPAKVIVAKRSNE
jgi:hypothetical protein